jgi:type I restriction enzyme S subunit
MMSGKMYRFRVDSDRTDPRYLEAFLQTERARLAIDKMKTGSSDSGLNLTHDRFRQLSIPVAPLPEQRRIVAEIEKQFTRLEAGVAALRRVQANLKRYRAAVLKAACEGKLVATEAELARVGRVPPRGVRPIAKNAAPWDAAYNHAPYETGEQLLQRILAERRKNWTGRGKYKEPGAPDPANLPPLPEGWTWASVEQISTRVVDGVHKKPNYVPSGIPFVTVRNLTAGPGISLERLHYITPHDHQEFIRRANPEPGDILVSKDGTLGVIRVIKTEEVFSIFVSVALVKPVFRDMSDFLAHALSAPQVQAQMVPKGSGLQHIHLEDLREDCVPLPPLAEQTRIVAEVERRLSVVEELEAVVSVNLQRATRLRQSILQKAFLGGLT